MKKVLISLMLILAAASGRAQIGSDFGVNMFMSMGGGVSVYHNLKVDNPKGFTGGVTVGKWILSPLAFRVTFDFMTVPRDFKGEEITGNYALASAEFMWDFNSTFFHITHSRINIYPMMGLGMAYRQPYRAEGASHKTDHDFQSMLGVHIPIQLGNSGWDAFLEYKCHFFPQAFDQGIGDVMMNSFRLGFTRRFFNSPFHRRTEWESNNPGEDWFFGIGFGPNFSSFTFTNFDKGDMYGFAPEFTVGRNYSNFWTIRFQLTGLSAHEPYDTVAQAAGDAYAFTCLHSDLMFNVSHLFKYTRGVRFNVLPYVGAGLVWRYDDIKFDMGADAGVMFRYCLSRKSDLTADIKYLMVPPRIGGGSGPNSSFGGATFSAGRFWVGIPSITLGYIYNFGHNTTRFRLPAHWCPE